MLCFRIIYYNLYPNIYNFPNILYPINTSCNTIILYKSNNTTVGKKCGFFVSALGNISIYALVILITLSVLMIFSNLTFPDAKQSGIQLLLEIQRVVRVQIRRSFVTIRDWSEKIE